MTTPDTAQPLPILPVPIISEDPLLDTIPGAIIAQQESPTVLRIGVVAEIIEGSQITVRISGSDVLVNCSYLFYQYFPLLGDRVIVLKQDSQWICLGQMSGAIGSNTPLLNSSFEDGVVGTAPTGWSLTVGLTGAGVPTFLVAFPGSNNISGSQVADFGTDSIGAGQSTATAFSTPVPAAVGSKWTGAYFLTSAFIGSSFPLFSSLELNIQFLDVVGAVITSNMINALDIGFDLITPIYRRLSLTLFPAGFVVAPAGTVSARIAFAGIFNLPAASFTSFYIDNVILREVQ